MANRTYQLEVRGVLNTSYRSMVLHFQSGGTNDNDTLAAGESLCNAFDSSLKTLFLNTLPSSYTLLELAARRVILKPSATACLKYLFAAYQGNRGVGGTGQQTCPSIFLVPTMGTKSGGRIFWPSIPQGDLSSNAYTAGWKTAVDAFLAAAIAGITSAGMTWTLAIYSRKTGGTANITSHQYSPVIGFQGKRRKPTGAV